MARLQDAPVGVLSGARLGTASRLLTGAACLVAALGPCGTVRAERALVRVRSATGEVTPAELAEAARALDEAGARMTHRVLPDVLVGELPDGAERGVVLPGHLLLETERARSRPVALPAAARGARAFVRGRAARLGPPLPPPPAIHHGDLVEPVPGDADGTLSTKALSAADCARPAATSAYLAGHVAIGVVLPQSTGAASTEDWATEDPSFPGEDRRDLVLAEIMEGADALATQWPAAGLTFTYDVHLDVPVPDEPITIPAAARHEWIGPAMDSMGYGARAPTTGVGGWLRELREDVDADWALAAFVIDDLEDDVSRFPFAYALLGGPYMVMTYDNSSWRIDRMDTVFRHELGHVFRALDEYGSAGNTCSMASGYLEGPHLNNDSGPGDPACSLPLATCAMRAQETTAFCRHTLTQIGIRDTDGDGVLDVRDAPPDSSFDDASPRIVRAAGVTLGAGATARSRAEESANAPVTWSVNRVAGMEVELDGGGWLPLAVRDGAPGGRCEQADVVLAGLSEGWHVVRVRATNDAGLVEPSPAEMRLYVNADCADDADEPDGDAASAVPRRAGTHGGLFHCAFDEDWSRVHLASGATLDVDLAGSPAAPLEVRILDEGGHALASGTTVGGTVSLSAVATRAGTHRVVVRGGEAETAYSLTLAADCIDDVAEEDDAPALARAFDPGTWTDRTLCPGEADVLLACVQAGESVSASISFDAALADLDLELLAPDGSLLAASAGGGPAEAVAQATTVEGCHAVRVVGKTPSDTGAYALTLAATGCLDDAFEDDDSAAAARALAGGDEARGRTCGTDEDWFAFTVAEPRLVRARLTHDPADGDLDLELRDAAGSRVLARSSRVTGTEDVTIDRLAAGEYRLRVFAPRGEGAAWRLGLEVEDPVLLFVTKDPSDAILSWNDAGQECYLARRSEIVSDFTGAVRTVVDGGVDDALDDVSWRDRGVIHDGRFLYGYLVSPADCGTSLVGSTKVAVPSPVVVPGIGGLPEVEYVITIANGGLEDAFDVTLVDDIAWNAGPFRVIEIPPGAVDASEPPPAGAANRGRVVVTGIDVPAGTERVVRFALQPSRNLVFEMPVVDNQAVLQLRSSSTGPGATFVTDDPSTRLFGDDTRVLFGWYGQQLVAHAFWHGEVDVDMRVVDPCGNHVGEADLPSATCDGLTTETRNTHSCAAPEWRYERTAVTVGWPGPGTWVVEVSYPSDASIDAACGDRGPEEITIALQQPEGAIDWRTLTLDPGTGWVEALRVVRP